MWSNNRRIFRHVLVIAFLHCGATNTGLFGEETRNTGNSSAKGIAATVTIPKKSTLGERFALSINIVNEGSGAVVIGEHKTFVDCIVRVKNAKTNKEVPHTTHGLNVIGEPLYGRSLGSYFRTKLEKGKSLDRTMDMTGCFDISQGEYVLSLVLKVNPYEATAFSVTVPDIPFELTGKAH
jgi:hypothetical protein